MTPSLRTLRGARSAPLQTVSMLSLLILPTTGLWRLLPASVILPCCGSSLLYPDYCDYDLQEEVTEYYELFYGVTLTDEQYATLTANAFFK